MVNIAGLLASSGLLSGAYAASSSTSASYSQFTIPAAANVGANLIANIDDHEAVNAQSVCPGYKASNVHQSSKGFTATLQLAGEPCNAYGIDVDSLDLSVEYQAKDRLNIYIVPSHVDASNASWYFLNEDVVPRPKVSPNASAADSDLALEWSNEPSFNFKVTRKATDDVLFNTQGSVLVYENQFIEFVTSLPEDYNIYGLGEHFQQLRILHNATLTAYGSDKGNPIDSNLYGSHPFYLDTRYFEQSKNGTLTPVKTSEADPKKEYKSFSHGVFLRNAHGLEVITQPQNLTWRTLGGSVDLTFYSGPSQAEVTKNYQVSTVGLPAMQQYNTLGYHQCRWGYTGWADLENVIADFEKFEIPVEYIWVDIDYMHGYRDFDNEKTNWSYEEGEKFLDKLHAGGRRFVPLVDSALYIPNPDNASDAYPTYDRGAADDLFLKNPDGSLYIGSVWPGYTVFPDWHHPKAGNFWANELSLWHEKVAYDGMWIDMGECSSFCVGSCGTDNLHLNPAHPPFALPGEPGNVDYNTPRASARVTPVKLHPHPRLLLRNPPQQPPHPRQRRSPTSAAYPPQPVTSTTPPT